MKSDRYLVIFEPGNDGSYSAYVPDVPGCVSCGDNIEEAQSMIGEALQFHLEGLRSAGLPVPQPTSFADYITARLN
jgi:predicted RNase H-like HicB family nuclease